MPGARKGAVSVEDKSKAKRHKLIELMAEAECMGDTDLALRIARRFWKLRKAERDRHLTRQRIDNYST